MCAVVIIFSEAAKKKKRQIYFLVNQAESGYQNRAVL